MRRRFGLVFILVLVMAGCGGEQGYPVVTLENAVSVTRVGILSGHAGGVNSVAWTADGKTLASAGDDAAIFIWDPAAGKEVRHWAAHKLAVTSLSFSPDGKMLASGGRDKAVSLWDPATGQQLRTFSDTDQVLTVAFSPDG